MQTVVTAPPELGGRLQNETVKKNASFYSALYVVERAYPQLEIEKVVFHVLLSKKLWPAQEEYARRAEQVVRT